MEVKPRDGLSPVCVRVLCTETSNWQNILQSRCWEFPALLHRFPHEQDVFKGWEEPILQVAQLSLPCGHLTPAQPLGLPSLAR